MAMTEGISVEGLEDSGNNLFAVASKVAEIIGMCCRGRLESVCACTKGRREEDCDGMGASFYGRRQTWALWHKTSRILSLPQFDFAPNRLSSHTR
jgi:hypothetical protein